LIFHKSPYEYRYLNVSTRAVELPGVWVPFVTTCLILKYRFLATVNAAVSREILEVSPARAVPAHVADPGTALVVVMAFILLFAGVPPPRKLCADVA